VQQKYCNRPVCNTVRVTAICRSWWPHCFKSCFVLRILGFLVQLTLWAFVHIFVLSYDDFAIVRWPIQRVHNAYMSEGLQYLENRGNWSSNRVGGKRRNKMKIWRIRTKNKRRKWKRGKKCWRRKNISRRGESGWGWGNEGIVQDVRMKGIQNKIIISQKAFIIHIYELHHYKGKLSKFFLSI
jgi:hypothetical protein